MLAKQGPRPRYGYCGTEQGDVLGHITSVALELVKSPLLWNKTTPVPDTLGFGKTYLDRARALPAECRSTIDTFIIPEMVDPATTAFASRQRRLRRARPALPGTCRQTVPWNQNTMLANGFLSIAMALESWARSRRPRSGTTPSSRRGRGR